MANVYRVFPYLVSAAPDQPGGAFYLPRQGGGRLDNPQLYSVFYVSDAAAGAVAEAFGRFPEWNSHMLAGSPSLPGSARALARFRWDAAARVCDLGDPARLVTLKLRPSEAVTRDYARSRAWAQRIFERREWTGVRWWSYYDPRWASIGLWDLSQLTLEDVAILRLSDAPVQEAGRAIVRQIATR